MITTKELKHLAELSRIKLTESDKKSLVSEFDSILNYVNRLKKVKVSLDVGARVGAVRNIARPDIVTNTSAEDRKAILREAPDKEGDFIAVKKIIAQE